MATQQAPRRLPNVKFRVLIIGRANSGKTSILQRVCDTTRSPVVYRETHPWNRKRIQLDPSIERGEHRIEDELIFSNHDGYIFHDSRGFESGDKKELEIVQNFVRQKSGERRLADRLHAIWYCIPMDNQRPELDLKHFKDICPDQNVPVIGVFTKYDQFRLNVEMDLEDHEDPGRVLTTEIEGRFQEHYLCHLGDGARFVQLEKMHKPGARCYNLIEETAGALNDDVVTLMLLAVQRSNVELSVKLAVKRVHPHFGGDAEDLKEIVKTCVIPFPYLWVYDNFNFNLNNDLNDYNNNQNDYNYQDLDLNDDNVSACPTSSALQREENVSACPTSSALQREELNDEDYLDDDDDDYDVDNFNYDDNDYKLLHKLVQDIMSMSTMRKFSTARNTRHHLIIAIITIMKHATTLRPSGLSPKKALAQAELDYWGSNIDSQVALRFTALPQQYSVQEFVNFIMDTYLFPIAGGIREGL